MPITKSEFERGKKIDEVEERIVSILEQNKDKAYTLMDIFNILFQRKSKNDMLVQFISVWSINITLNNLVRDGRVIKKQIRYQDYYSIP
jgi:hypothetical protein